MFAAVSGAPNALRIASDHASSLAPRGVWYSAVGVGTRTGLDGVAVGRAVRRTGGFAAGDVTGGRVGADVGELEASGLKLAVGGAKLAVGGATLDGATLGWLVTGAAARGSLVVWAERDTAPIPTAMAAPSRAAAEPRTAINRNDTGRRLTRALGRARDPRGRPDVCRPLGKRFKLDSPNLKGRLTAPAW